MQRINLGIFSIIGCLLVLLMGCERGVSTDISHKVRGSYKAFLSTEYKEPDGMSCKLDIRSIETFGDGDVTTEATMKLMFHFGGSLEFSDLEMTYNFSLRGLWSVADSLLTIELDMTTFEQQYVGSNARSVVENAMIRQLKKYVDTELRAKLFTYLTDVCHKRHRICRVCKNGIIGSVDNKTIVMLRAGKANLPCHAAEE